MCTRNELNLILQAMTQAYQAVYGANVVKIILYGSYARGDYQKDSDIDIVAIVQGDREKLQQGLKSVLGYFFRLGIRVWYDSVSNGYSFC